MRPVWILACTTLMGACSIDFVSLEEAPVGTLIEVTAHHTDSLRAAVTIRHRGGVVDFVSVNDEGLLSAGVGPTGETTFDFDLTVDVAERVLDVRVDQHPSAPRLLELRIPLLVRAGEATCSPEGALVLPVELDEAGIAGFHSSWLLELVDTDGHVSASLESLTELPRPVEVPGDLVDDSVTTARLSVRVSGAVEDAPHDAHLGATTGTEWTVAGPCP